MTFPKALSLAALLLVCNAMAGLYASAALASILEALPASVSHANAAEPDPVPISAPPAEAVCIKAPDAPQNPGDKGRLPGQAFPSEPLDEEEMGAALGPVALVAGSIVLLGGMTFLLWSGLSSFGYGDEPDTTYGLRPGR